MVTWAKGFTQGELDTAQERFGLRFPPDLVSLLRERNPVGGYDWRTESREIEKALAWPLEGLLFDVENNALWLDDWGPKPRKASARAEVVTAIVARAPRLIPVYGHRYIPETPHAAGNPVLSVYQSDIIVYGTTLERYVSNDFGFSAFEADGPTRHIPFWSEFTGEDD